MFDFVGKFFTGRPDKKAVTAKAQAQAKAAAKHKPSASRSTSGIKYDATLIDNLEHDHEQLVELFGKVWKGYEASDFEALSVNLVEFKTLFQSHLLKENVKFYAYLEQTMRADAHSLSVVREFRRDMNDIANAVISFCKKYERSEYTKVAKDSFKKEYQGIGQALVRRVQLEERDLYSLYAPA